MAASPEQIRADGFASFEGELGELATLAAIASLLIETFAQPRAAGETVTLRADTAEMIDYAAARVSSMAKALSGRWDEIHNRACEQERAGTDSPAQSPSA